MLGSMRSRVISRPRRRRASSRGSRPSSCSGAGGRMRLFRRGSAEQGEARRAAEAEQAASIEALARGELPLRAQQRLAELGKGGVSLFTSDLSVSEFALIDQAGLRALSQVM